MKSIALRPWELAAYMRHKKLLVVRPVKPQPAGVIEPDEGFVNVAPDGTCWGRSRYPIYDEGGFVDEGVEEIESPIKCPFGKPGEVLGIKEAVGFWNHMGTICTPKVEYGDDLQWAYLADQEGVSEEVLSRIRWRPAYRCPLWAVRFKPTIADIRVMRVGEMDDEDAELAGVTTAEWRAWCPDCKGHGVVGSCLADMRDCRFDCSSFKGGFAARWEADHGKGSWATSPWCWFMNVVE